tara:strand:- start:21 stop:662 length:642 start_codon:yes stop_codon:yes gene_type:complete
MVEHKARDPFAVYGENWFHFKNMWAIVNKDTDSVFTHPFDVNEFETYEDWRADKPEQWLQNFTVRFTGAEGKPLPIFGDPNEVFTRTNCYYVTHHARVFYCEGKHYVGIRISGLDDWYDARYFTSKAITEEIDNFFKIVLTDPPKTIPERGTVEYKQLYKETGGTCIVQDVAGEYNPNFDYLNYIQVTRTPEQYPKWLTDLLNKPSTAKPRKK